MTTFTINGTDNTADAITVTNALVGPGFAYLINLAPGVGLADSLIVNGAGSDDTLNLSLLTSLSGLTELDLFGGAGNDVIFGSTTHDHQYGGTGADTLFGGLGNDTLQGDAEADVMEGGFGNDVFLITADHGQGDIFDGGSDFDVIRNIPGQTISFSNISAINLIEIEQIDGSNSVISGTAGNDVLDFSAIQTAIGVTAFNGGAGDDIIRGVTGTAVRLEGAAGQDTLLGNALGEALDGGADNDNLRGNGGNDTLDGGEGADKLFGGDGDDLFLMLGSQGQGDIYSGGDGMDTLRHSNTGQPITLTGVGPANFISIEVFDGAGSSMNGDSSANRLDFSAIDIAINLTGISGGDGNDTLVAFGSTAIAINGDAGNDRIIGNSQAEVLNGGSGIDNIYGGVGNDSIDGGSEADNLYGGAGDDLFLMLGIQGQGDRFYGGSGTDTIRHSNTGQPIFLSNAGPANFVSVEVFDGIGSSMNGTAGNNRLDFSSIATAINLTGIFGGDGNDTLIAFGSTAIALSGDAGNDRIVGNALSEVLNGDSGFDTLLGGAGNDTLDGGADADVIFGGDGNDLINWLGAEGQGDTINGGAGTDTLRQTNVGQPLVILNARDANFIGVERFDLAGSSVNGSDAANLIDFSAIGRALNFGTINGLGGDDTLIGFGGTAVILNGGSGNDVITGNGKDETLNGDADNDRISGVNGDDQINGGTGNDTLLGGAGSDTLTGGSGADQFVFTLALHSLPTDPDVITDFEGAGAAIGDRIRLSGIDADTTLIGNQNFTFNSVGVAGLSLASDGTDTLVQLNTDADAEFEMVIRLTDGGVAHTVYVAADFFL